MAITLSDRVTAFLDELSISKTAFCRNVRISVSTLWRWQHDQLELSNDTLQRIDDYLIKYFDLYIIEYQIKSISQIDNRYTIVDYYKPDKQAIKDRLKIYTGAMNQNLNLKPTGLSSTYFKSSYNKRYILQLKNNLYNYFRNVVKAPGDKVMWTTFADSRNRLKGRGYSSGFVPCNCRASNDYQDRTSLAYCINWYVNPEITKFFEQHGIKINQDSIALSSLLQWIWRSNIRVTSSNEIINLYLPSERMRTLLTNWLNDAATSASKSNVLDESVKWLKYGIYEKFS